MPLRISTQRLIRSFGFRTEVFTSAQEFLESGCVQEIACLILEFAAARQVPIIFVSASGSDRHEREALEAGAIGFLRKPVSEQSLINAIPKNIAAHGAPKRGCETQFKTQRAERVS